MSVYNQHNFKAISRLRPHTFTDSHEIWNQRTLPLGTKAERRMWEDYFPPPVSSI